MTKKSLISLIIFIIFYLVFLVFRIIMSYNLVTFGEYTRSINVIRALLFILCVICIVNFFNGAKDKSYKYKYVFTLVFSFLAFIAVVINPGFATEITNGNVIVYNLFLVTLPLAIFSFLIGFSCLFFKEFDTTFKNTFVIISVLNLTLSLLAFVFMVYEAVTYVAIIASFLMIICDVVISYLLLSDKPYFKKQA